MGNQFSCDVCDKTHNQKIEIQFESQLKLPKKQVILNSGSPNQPEMNNQKKIFANEVCSAVSTGAPIQLENIVLYQTNSKQQGNTLIELANPYEIYLSIDEVWVHRMKLLEQQALEIEKVYREIPNMPLRQSHCEIKCFQRSSLGSKKIQMLFKQHIPLVGKYFFQVQLISYIVSKKCQFTIGVTNYELASQKIYSRDSNFEQSFTFRQRQFDIDKDQQNKPFYLNNRLKVEISRSSQPFIAFYINDKINSKQQLRKQFQQDILSLVPYIQTQEQGIVFKFKCPFKRSINPYVMSTIPEQSPYSTITT